MKITKRSLLRGSVGVCAVGVLTAACGGGGTSSNNNNTGGSSSTGGGACTTAISANHGHAMTVSAADKLAGAAKDYDIKGSADHTHTVSLSAADFADLAAGTVVTVTSSTNASHSHDVTITC